MLQKIAPRLVDQVNSTQLYDQVISTIPILEIVIPHRKEARLTNHILPCMCDRNRRQKPVTYSEEGRKIVHKIIVQTNA